MSDFTTAGTYVLSTNNLLLNELLRLKDIRVNVPCFLFIFERFFGNISRSNFTIVHKEGNKMLFICLLGHKTNFMKEQRKFVFRQITRRHNRTTAPGSQEMTEAFTGK